MEISKELLSEVLGCNIIMALESADEKNILYKTTNNHAEEINIYELAHKCKEWAKEKGYIIECYPHIALSTKYIYCVSKFNYSIGFVEKDIETGNEDTDAEAVFKASQWVLDNA